MDTHPFADFSALLGVVSQGCHHTVQLLVAGIQRGHEFVVVLGVALQLDGGALQIRETLFNAGSKRLEDRLLRVHFHVYFERRMCIFSRTPPQARPVVEQILNAAGSTVMEARVNQQRLWGCICSEAAHHIWRLRNDALFRAIVIPTEGRTRSIWRAVENQLRSLLVRGQTTTVAGLPHFDVFWTALRSDNPPAAPVDVEARLYFDGGARGNPGIAGSGSVIVERTTGDDHWNIVWWKATYLGDSHTNNTAEHAALHDGLVECAARYREQNVRVLIVGDSHLVLSQLLGTARCKTPHLRCLQEQSSLLLRTLTTAQVRHTLRAGNTMTDYLANMAMNTKNCHRSDPNWTPTDEHLTRMLPDDTAHPHSDVTVKSAVDLLERTRRYIQHYEADDASASGLKPA